MELALHHLLFSIVEHFAHCRMHGVFEFGSKTFKTLVMKNGLAALNGHPDPPIVVPSALVFLGNLGVPFPKRSRSLLFQGRGSDVVNRS